MKKTLVIAAAAFVAIGASLASISDASAYVCARGAYRAGCVGPRGGAVVRRGYYAPRGAVVVRRPYYRPRGVVIVR